MSQADAYLYLFIFQTSAKNCDNVDRLFTEIAHELLQQVILFTLFLCLKEYKIKIIKMPDVVPKPSQTK